MHLLHWQADSLPLGSPWDWNTTVKWKIELRTWSHGGGIIFFTSCVMENNVFFLNLLMPFCCLNTVSYYSSGSVNLNSNTSIIFFYNFTCCLFIPHLLFYLYYILIVSMCQHKSTNNLFQISLIIAFFLLTRVLSIIWFAHLNREEINVQNGQRVPPTLKL